MVGKSSVSRRGFLVTEYLQYSALVCVCVCLCLCVVYTAFLSCLYIIAMTICHVCVVPRAFPTKRCGKNEHVTWHIHVFLLVPMVIPYKNLAIGPANEKQAALGGKPMLKMNQEY